MKLVKIHGYCSWLRVRSLRRYLVTSNWVVRFHFNGSRRRLAEIACSRPTKSIDMDEAEPVIWVDSQESLSRMIAELKLSELFALDLEHHSIRSFLGFTCLMQIFTRTIDWLVDTIKLLSFIHHVCKGFSKASISSRFFATGKTTYAGSKNTLLCT